MLQVPTVVGSRQAVSLSPREHWSPCMPAVQISKVVPASPPCLRVPGAARPQQTEASRSESNGLPEWTARAGSPMRRTAKSRKPSDSNSGEHHAPFADAETRVAIGALKADIRALQRRLDDTDLRWISKNRQEMLDTLNTMMLKKIAELDTRVEGLRQQVHLLLPAMEKSLSASQEATPPQAAVPSSLPATKPPLPPELSPRNEEGQFAPLARIAVQQDELRLWSSAVNEDISNLRRELTACLEQQELHRQALQSVLTHSMPKLPVSSTKPLRDLALSWLSGSTDSDQQVNPEVKVQATDLQAAVSLSMQVPDFSQEIADLRRSLLEEQSESQKCIGGCCEELTQAIAEEHKNREEMCETLLATVQGSYESFCRHATEGAFLQACTTQLQAPSERW